MTMKGRPIHVGSLIIITKAREPIFGNEKIWDRVDCFLFKRKLFTLNLIQNEKIVQILAIRTKIIWVKLSRKMFRNFERMRAPLPVCFCVRLQPKIKFLVSMPPHTVIWSKWINYVFIPSEMMCLKHYVTKSRYRHLFARISKIRCEWLGSCEKYSGCV